MIVVCACSEDGIIKNTDPKHPLSLSREGLTAVPYSSLWRKAQRAKESGFGRALALVLIWFGLVWFGLLDSLEGGMGWDGMGNGQVGSGQTSQSGTYRVIIVIVVADLLEKGSIVVVVVAVVVNSSV